MKVMNKTGQQMTLGTIIAIVLGIAVLVFLIFGFSTGWNNLWDKIGNLGGGSANVDAVIQGCAVACSSNSIDAFCRQTRKVNYGDNTWDEGSCYALLNGADVKAEIGTCSLDCSGVESADKLTNQDSEDEEDEEDETPPEEPKP
jgi:hypothetical protein